MSVAEEIVEKHSGVTASLRCLQACVEQYASCSVVVFLREQNLVAEKIAVLRSAGGGHGSLLIIYPRAYGVLRVLGVHGAGGVEIQILSVAVERQSLSEPALGKAVPVGGQRIVVGRLVREVAVERIIEQQFFLRVSHLLLNLQSDAFCPVVPQSLHFPHLVGMLGCHVVGFGIVCGEVEQLPSAVAQ